MWLAKPGPPASLPDQKACIVRVERPKPQKVHFAAFPTTGNVFNDAVMSEPSLQLNNSNPHEFEASQYSETNMVMLSFDQLRFENNHPNAVRLPALYIVRSNVAGSSLKCLQSSG